MTGQKCSSRSDLGIQFFVPGSFLIRILSGSNLEQDPPSLVLEAFNVVLSMFINDDANIPIYGIDLNGQVNKWNNKSVAIIGFSPQEVLGRN